MILDTGKTPEEWADIMVQRGLPVSARTLRQKANSLGACHKLGRAMIITPEQLDQILAERKPECRSNRTSGARHGGRAGGSNITAFQSPATTAAALERLRQQALGNGVARKKNDR